MTVKCKHFYILAVFHSSSSVHFLGLTYNYLLSLPKESKKDFASLLIF